MSTVTITVQCPAILYNEATDEDSECEADIDVECEAEPGEMYGADADGNRGEWREGGIVPCDPPEECPECHTKFDQFQLAELAKRIKDKCADWHYEPPDPDFDY